MDALLELLQSLLNVFWSLLDVVLAEEFAQSLEVAHHRGFSRVHSPKQAADIESEQLDRLFAVGCSRMKSTGYPIERVANEQVLTVVVWQLAEAE